MPVTFSRRVINKLKHFTLDQIENFNRKYLYYTPTYHRAFMRVFDVDSTPPEVFNRYGEKMNVFFLADICSAHYPYGSVHNRYILWDRYNFALKTHFYSHSDIFNTVGKPDKKFAMLAESRSIASRDYKKVIRNKKYIENEFDAIFTYNEEILDTCNNAKFLPFCANFYYMNDDKKNISPNEDEYKNKNKNVSILASNKGLCKMHEVRKNLARKLKRDGLADTFGKFDGGAYAVLEDTLKDYRFQFVLENDVTDYYFTEKITNCFAAQTIPIYLGAQKINEFFSPEGIIKISLKDLDNIEKILAQCTPQEYERRLPAVLENFQRVKKYRNIFDYLYEEYFIS